MKIQQKYSTVLQKLNSLPQKIYTIKLIENVNFFFFLFKLRHLSAILCRMFTGSLFQFNSLSSSLHSN